MNGQKTWARSGSSCWICIHQSYFCKDGDSLAEIWPPRLDLLASRAVDFPKSRNMNQIVKETLKNKRLNNTLIFYQILKNNLTWRYSMPRLGFWLNSSVPFVNNFFLCLIAIKLSCVGTRFSLPVTTV